MKINIQAMENPSESTKCPNCGNVYTFSPALIENAPGTETWSDGFISTSLHNDVLEFAKCMGCQNLFFIQDNLVENNDDTSAIKKIDNEWLINEVGNKEIIFIKEALRLIPGKEIQLRIKLWHLINHFYRQYDSQGFMKKWKTKLLDGGASKDSLKQYKALSSMKISNLIRLVNLLKADKTTSHSSVLFAEIYRELGDFSKAITFCHKAETTMQMDQNRIKILKQQISNKVKTVYKL